MNVNEGKKEVAKEVDSKKKTAGRLSKNSNPSNNSIPDIANKSKFALTKVNSEQQLFN